VREALEADPAATVAVVLPNLARVSKWEQFLQNNDVPLQTSSMQSYYEQPSVAFLMAMLTILSDPSSDSAVSELLQPEGGTIGSRASDMSEGSQDEGLGDLRRFQVSLDDYSLLISAQLQHRVPLLRLVYAIAEHALAASDGEAHPLAFPPQHAGSAPAGQLDRALASIRKAKPSEQLTQACIELATAVSGLLEEMEEEAARSDSCHLVEHVVSSIVENSELTNEDDEKKALLLFLRKLRFLVRARAKESRRRSGGGEDEDGGYQRAYEEFTELVRVLQQRRVLNADYFLTQGQSTKQSGVVVCTQSNMLMNGLEADVVFLPSVLSSVRPPSAFPLRSSFPR
jgi:hypothetical protein